MQEDHKVKTKAYYLSHPVSKRQPNANHMYARIKFHTYGTSSVNITTQMLNYTASNIYRETKVLYKTNDY